MAEKKIRIPNPAAGRKAAARPARVAGLRSAGARKAKPPKPLPPHEVHEVFERLRAQRPEPRTELESVNAYTLLVAVALSAQMTDAGVNKATRPLFAAVDTPQKMIDLGEDKLLEAIRTINFNRTKARNVIALSRRLVDDFGGEVPHSREALETLPGVGRKTANVILNSAFGEKTLAVDTHVFRVSNRLPIAPGATVLDVELGLMERVPDEFLTHAHHWLILHGRYTCKAVKPLCPSCVVSDLCRYPFKTPPAPPPALPDRVS
jgi:endonuclease-3